MQVEWYELGVEPTGWGVGRRPKQAGVEAYSSANKRPLGSYHVAATIQDDRFVEQKLWRSYFALRSSLTCTPLHAHIAPMMPTFPDRQPCLQRS